MAGGVCFCGGDARTKPNAPAPVVINTDRPAFADSSNVVPKDSLVIENGFLESSTDGSETFDFPEWLMRLGILDKTEIRFSVPDYFHPAGWSDSSLGIKQQLGPVGGFDVSLVVTLSFPSGSRTESSHGMHLWNMAENFLHGAVRSICCILGLRTS